VKPGQVTALLVALAAAPEVSSDVPFDEPRPGDRFDRFQIVRRVGAGGFGVVFEARDDLLGRPVALKFVRPHRHSGRSPEWLLEEAEAAARLSHPGIVTIHDVGRSERGPFLVQELLSGETLSERLERGPLPLRQAVETAAEVARALAHAHRHGVVHRDLKPSNIFLCEDGRVKVLDFGMAVAFGHTRPEGGTPAYMAPEQRSGAPEDERSDVHALGATLFQCLTGELPFGGDGLRRLPLPGPHLDIRESPELSDLVRAMLERDPLRRPRDGAAALQALEPIVARLRPQPEGGSRPVRRRRRWPLILAGAVAGVVAAALVGLAWGSRPSTTATGRLLLAVADISNETGEKELELSGLLRTVLEQSSFLNVLPGGRLLDAVPREDLAVRPTEAQFLSAARSVNARCVLLARLLKLGEAYLLEVRAIDPETGENRFSFKEQDRGKERISGLLDRAGERVRLQLGEAAAGVHASKVNAAQVTESLEAWRLYTSGLRCFERRYYGGSFGSCLEDLEKAVAIDPGFALAHLQIAILRCLDGQPRAQQQQAVRQAQAHLDRIPPRDRDRLAGWDAYLSGREAEAKRLLLRAAEASPDDKYAWYLAALLPWIREEFDEALPLLRRIHELDPSWRIVTVGLAMSLGAGGDFEGLSALARELLAKAEGGSQLVSACYVQLWTEPAQALATCRRARSAGVSAETDEALATALLNVGAWAELDELLVGMRQRDARGWTPGAPRGFAWSMQLWLLGQRGRWKEVERLAREEGVQTDPWFQSQLAEMLAGAGDVEGAVRTARRVIAIDPGVATNLAVHLAYLGDLRRAAELEAYLSPDSPRLEVYQALVRWRSGKLGEALARLQHLASRAPIGVDPAIPPPLFLLGEALADAGRDAEAVATLRRFRRLPQTYPTLFWPRAEWLIARSLERQGDLDGAKVALAPLLKQWSRATDRQPHLAEARALATKLGIQ
jgi:predicted Zn-dependent protease